MRASPTGPASRSRRARSAHEVREATAAGIYGIIGGEMITASLLPLGVLLAARLLGTTLRTAVLAALGCSTVLLCMAGWRIGRYGRLSALEKVLSSAIAGLFGVTMIVLKALLHAGSPTRDEASGRGTASQWCHGGFAWRTGSASEATLSSPSW